MECKFTLIFYSCKSQIKKNKNIFKRLFSA